MKHYSFFFVMRKTSYLRISQFISVLPQETKFLMQITHRILHFSLQRNKFQFFLVFSDTNNWIYISYWLLKLSTTLHTVDLKNNHWYRKEDNFTTIHRCTKACERFGDTLRNADTETLKQYRFTLLRLIPRGPNHMLSYLVNIDVI